MDISYDRVSGQQTEIKMSDCGHSVFYLLRLYKVSGDSSSLHVTSLQTEPGQSQEQTQPATQPGQEVAPAHVREQTCPQSRDEDRVGLNLYDVQRLTRLRDTERHWETLGFP